MTELFKDFEIFGLAISPMLISLGACIAKTAQEGWHGFRNFIRNYVTCCFMGVITYWGLDYFDLPPTVDAAITGGCLYASMALLNAITFKMVSVIRGFRVAGVDERQEREKERNKIEN